MEILSVYFRQMPNKVRLSVRVKTEDNSKPRTIYLGSARTMEQAKLMRKEILTGRRSIESISAELKEISNSNTGVKHIHRLKDGSYSVTINGIHIGSIRPSKGGLKEAKEMREKWMAENNS